MQRATVAGRLVTWALILLGSAEVAWVVYLAFTQVQVVRIVHVRLATLGLGAFAVGLCVAAALAVQRRSPWTPVACVSAATTLAFLATFGKLTPALDTSGLLGSAQRPLLVVLPGVLAACWAAMAALRAKPPVPVHPADSTGSGAPPTPALGDRTGDPVRRQVAILVLAATAVVLLARIILHVLQWDSTALATQSRAIIVILDTGETIGMLGAGLASLGGRPRATLVLATIAGSLLICDAFGNVVMAGSPDAFAAAIVYLVVGEIPSILACLLAVRAAHRRWSESIPPGLGDRPGAGRTTPT